jgi:DNA-binding transcriptional ArsR family regulator
MRTKAPLLAPLFRTEGQAAILAEILLTGETIGMSDLARRVDLAKSSVHREVTRLVDAGLLEMRVVGREWQLSANLDSPLTEPVRTILAVAYGPVPMLTEALSEIPGVEAAVLFGSFAARASGIPGAAPNDIDVLVVGEPAMSAISVATRRVAARVGRPVNPSVMTAAEWDDLVARGSSFAQELTSRPTIALVGSLAGVSPVLEASRVPGASIGSVPASTGARA